MISSQTDTLIRPARVIGPRQTQNADHDRRNQRLRAGKPPATALQPARLYSSVHSEWPQGLFQVGKPYALDVPGQTELLQRPDAVPIEVNFIPLQTMARETGMRVVIVVPAFAQCQQRHPPAVAWKDRASVKRREPHECVAELTSQVACSPTTVRTKDTPHDEWQAADGEQYDAEHNYRDVMIFRDPDVEPVFGEVGNVTGYVVVSWCIDFPSVSIPCAPTTSIDRRMRVAFLIRILMMNAMRGYPENRAAFSASVAHMSGNIPPTSEFCNRDE